MHPILFRIPGLDWPVRMFGLYIIDAFFVATLWVQWQYAKRKDAAFAAEPGLTKVFRILLFGIVISRIVFLAAPVSWPVRVVGVLVVDYFLAAIAWVQLTSAFKKHEIARGEADFVFNLAFWLLLIGFFGARLFWIITTPRGQQTFADKPLEALFAVWDGGIVYYGGLLCAAGFGVWYLWIKNRKILVLGDLLMVGVALTYFIGRWSCLSAGDDFGRPTNVPWAIKFPQVAGSQIPQAWQSGPGHPGVAIHPSQLYMSLDGLLIALILIFVLKRKKFDGQLTFLFLMLYPIGRSIAEMFRGDVSRGVYHVFGIQMSSSQIISVPTFLVAAILYLRGWIRSRRSGLNSPTPETA